LLPPPFWPGSAITEPPLSSPSRKRIERIITADAETPEEELAKPFVQRVLLPLGDSVAKLFRGYTPAEVAERTQKKLVMAGLYPRVTAVQLIGLCWFSAAGCVILMFLMILALGNSPGGDFKYADPWNIAYLLIGAVGGYILPQFVLGRKVRKRQEQILVESAVLDRHSLDQRGGGHGF
jgi:hypothetical protein